VPATVERSGIFLDPAGRTANILSSESADIQHRKSVSIINVDMFAMTRDPLSAATAMESHALAQTIGQRAQRTRC
jgi:hypothetical protein